MNRLFDIFEQNAQQNPEAVLFGYKENNVWKKRLNKDVLIQVHNLANSLLELLGLPEKYTPEHQHKIGIISNNRPEWIITDLAIQEASAIITPIYPTVSVPDLEFILEESNVKYIFISDQNIYNRFESVLSKNKYKIFSFDRVHEVESWESLLHHHANEDLLHQSKNNITGDTLATIIYTSGTTGKPKGVMLTHNNILSNVIVSSPILYMAKPGDKALSFLPLNHIFEKMVTYIYLNLKLSIYYAESLETIGENLREVKPIVFTCVPRVLEKVYDKILAKGNALKGIKRALFFWALNLAKKFDNHKEMGLFYNMQLNIANKLIFNKWREALGNNVIAIISGSAALNPDLIRIFTAARIIILEGYGLTETSPVISVNRVDNENRWFGTVGPVLDDIKVKIADDGEILCKGPNIMMGYYKNQEKTDEILTPDGWLKTGDIGEFINGKFLKITDRKKEMFKTSGGKYVAPQFLENIYRSCQSINQIMIVGNNRKFVGALIVPEWSYLEKELNNGTPYSASERAQLLTDKKIIKFIKNEMATLNTKISHVEQVKRIALVSKEWDVDSGILTPKLSLRRKVAEETFKKEIESIYNIN